MRLLAKYFLRGLLVIVPAAATVWMLYAVFRFTDGLVQLPAHPWTLPWLGWRVPGAPTDFPGLGVLVTLLLITATGLLASTFLTRWLFVLGESIFTRMPLVKLVYTSVKDLIEAFVSDKKKFDKPVLLTLSPGIEVIGFITRDGLEELGEPDTVAVYVPQSYNFAANLILVPRERVRPIDCAASDVMAFVVSGGVSSAAQTGNGEAARARRRRKRERAA